MKNLFKITLLICLALFLPSLALAVEEVPANDWSYSAVSDLAAKGMIKGYPKDKDLFAGRTVSRYEMAALVQRAIARVVDDQTAGTAEAPQTLDELGKLISEYKIELTVMQTDLSSLKLDVKALDTKVGDQQKAVDNSYGASLNRKFSITGLIQSRIVQADTGNQKYFPQGSNNSLGIGSAFNGSYATGGTAGSLEVKRARIIMIGQPDANTMYKFQLDTAGAVNNASGATVNPQVKVLEAYGAYTPGNGTSKYPSITMGEFANPYGYIEPASPAAFITPERPLAFSENNNVGLFDSQDYDKGLRLLYQPSSWKFTYALVNGAGRQSENVYDHYDSIYRIAYATPNKVFNMGTSYYDGLIYRVAAADSLATYPEPKKRLFGLDGQINLLDGIFVDGEYIRGTYEKRSYFDEALDTGAKPMGGDVLQTDSYVKGNQVQGYYVWTGYTFNRASNHAFTLATDYDVFQRSMSSTAGAGDVFGNGSNSAGNSSYDDVNYGFGAMYNLDKATRFRLWYERPTEVAHEPGTPTPPRIGLTTAEWQYRFF